SIYPKYAKERTIDKLVNGTLEKFTEENTLSLNHMLASTDETTVELVLKVLLAMNVKERHATVTYLLYRNYENIANSKSMETTEISQVFKSMKIDTRYIAYDSISALAQTLELNTWKTATSDDKSLACILCRSIITNFYKEKDKEVMDKLYRLPFK